MLKTLLNAVGLLACMAWFNLASAANMGGINVTSALGHPLKAEISLAELGKNDKSTLVAKMASINEFKSAGLDYPYSLPKLSFEIETRASGETYIKLTSTQPVNEPFVSLLIELSWPSGKLLRVYTFLLDPAGFVPEQPKVAEVKPVEPMLPVQEAVPEVVPAPAITPEPAVLPYEPATAPATPPVASAIPPVAEDGKAATVQAAPVLSDMDKAELAAAEQAAAAPGKVTPFEPVKVEPLAPASILVEKGDTLGKIAEEAKPVEVSLERMLVAMYRANAKKFDGKNMNRIKAGRILRMPDSDEIAKVTQAAAVKEIRAQVADWQVYRQKLAAAQSAPTEREPKQEAAGKISAAVAEKAPAVKDSAKEVLKLSKGESLGDKVVAGDAAKSKQEKAIVKADDAAAKKKQFQEEQKRIAKLESISKEASKLVELKAQPVEKPAAGKNLPASSPQAVVKGLTAQSAVPVAKQESAVKPEAVAKTETDELDIPGLFNKYLSMAMAMLPDDPMILAAGVAVLLGLGGLGFVMARRGKGGQKKSRKKSKEVGESTGSWRTPVAPSPDTGDFTQSFSSSNAASPSAPMSVAAALDDVDPISEADLFLNFGRDAQAEEILKDALSTNPSNTQVKLKLLSIYVNRKDTKSFSKYAQEVKDSGDTAAWERAAVMGREIDPSNPNYGGVKGEARQREKPKGEVDFDLGLGKAAAPPETANPVAAKDFKMDFDLSASRSSVFTKPVDLSDAFAKTSGVSQAKASADVDATSILSREIVHAVQASQSAQPSSPMDFDVSGILPGEIKNVPQSSPMDFDISGVIPEGKKKAAPSSSMDFDISVSDFENTAVIPKKSPNTPPAPAAINFDNLVFEIPTSQSASAQEKSKPAAREGMAFSIDFPTGDNTKSSSGKPEAVRKLDMDFGDININLDDDMPLARAGGEGKDEQWHEVATKLDLAKAYQEMGDADGAREILEEVLRDGDVMQREAGEKLLQQIAA